MLKRFTLRILFLSIIVLVSRTNVLAQTDPIEHIWYNEEKTAKIQLYKGGDGKYYGKIAWMKEPNRDGKPKLDIHNIDESKRNNPVMGMVIVNGLKKKNDHLYEDGTVYDPKGGKTYSCKMTLEGQKLTVRGYIGFSMLGRSTKWTKAD